jgi:hypothetical protein
MKKIILLATAAITLSSCATIFTGSKKRVTFDANIDQEATLTIDGYAHRNITFPDTTNIRGGFDETIVKAESEGYKTTHVIINKNFNAVSVLNLFDMLTWGIDAATGAIMKPEFKFYEFEFEKENK